MSAFPPAGSPNDRAPPQAPFQVLYSNLCRHHRSVHDRISDIRQALTHPMVHIEKQMYRTLMLAYSYAEAGDRGAARQALGRASQLASNAQMGFGGITPNVDSAQQAMARLDRNMRL